MTPAVERERVTTSGFFPPWIRHEHRARYLFAAQYAAGRGVIDCACSDGAYTRLLGEVASNVRGFDISADAIAGAQEQNSSQNIQYEVGDALALPVVDASADLFVSLETIEHVPDGLAFLREISRVLRDDGTLICSTPDRNVYSPGHARGAVPWNRYHLHEFTRDEFQALLHEFFADVELFGQNPKLPALVGARMLLGRILPWNLMVRMNQALKLPRFLHDPPARHAVVPAGEARRYEILVAVCRTPRPRRNPSGAGI